jgi:hypothetical protein
MQGGERAALTHEALPLYESLTELLATSPNP